MARKKAGGGPILLGVVGLVVAVLVGSWAWAQFGGRLPVVPSWRDKAGKKRAAGERVIRVQVLNGSGEAGIGTRVAAYLRAGGFHVVEVRNADRGDYFASLVVARRSDLSLAREVSHYLGGPPLIQQAWDSELADVSVLIGSDRSHLRLEP